MSDFDEFLPAEFGQRKTPYARRNVLQLTLAPSLIVIYSFHKKKKFVSAECSAIAENNQQFHFLHDCSIWLTAVKSRAARQNGGPLYCRESRTPILYLTKYHFIIFGWVLNFFGAFSGSGVFCLFYLEITFFKPIFSSYAVSSSVISFNLYAPAWTRCPFRAPILR